MDSYLWHMKWLLLISTLLSTQTAIAQNCCGSTAYCNKRFNQMVFVSTHNSYNYKKGPTQFIWPNHTYPVKKQLADGVRNLMLDVYDIDGTIYLYHGNPKMGKEKLQIVLTDIKAFLDSNKTEIVSIIFQNGITKNRIAAEIDSAGLSTYCHSQAADKEWPTIGQMINDNNRLVLFVEENTGTDVPYIHSAWDYIFDTPWNTKSLAEMDTRIGRGKPTHGLFLMNNWISKGKPTKKNARQTNNEKFLLKRIERCAKDLHRVPNFIGINFHEQGDAVKVAKMLNDGLADTLLEKP